MSEHDVGIHAREHAACAVLHNGVLPAIVHDSAVDVVEAAHVVRLENSTIRHVQTFEDIRHVAPAVERQGNGRVLLVVVRSAGQIAAVVVERLVKRHDCLGLAERLDKERVVRPAGTRVRHEADIALVQEVATVDGAPDAGMLLHHDGQVGQGHGTRGIGQTVRQHALLLVLR